MPRSSYSAPTREYFSTKNFLNAYMHHASIVKGTLSQYENIICKYACINDENKCVGMLHVLDLLWNF